MTKEQIQKITFKGDVQKPELIETHISWVLLGDALVYKIKKPIKYSFLDFSTIELRKYYCDREIELNKRLTENLYLDVQPVVNDRNFIFIGNGEGEVIDYAVRMRKFDRTRQMNNLLLANQVTDSNIRNLAKKIAAFHQTTRIIFEKDIKSLHREFNDLKNEKQYLAKYLAAESCKIIDDAVDMSDLYIRRSKKHFDARLKEGFFRDCHGDLHSRNIFLLPDAQPFDCIEFNDELRKIDVLNEAAFLCMDLDAFGRFDFSELFLSCYNELLRTVRSKEDYMLFIYYKLYRANIRAKVNSLRAQSVDNDTARAASLRETEKYLQLMNSYMKLLKAPDVDIKLNFH